MKQKTALFVCLISLQLTTLPGVTEGFQLVDNNNLKLTLGLRFGFLGDYIIPENKADVSIRSARMTFRGEMYDWLEFKLSSEAQIPDKDANEYSFLLRDLYIQHVFHDYIGLRLGQFKVPFGEEIFNSLGERPYIDRTETTRKIVPGRDIGFMAFGKNIISLFGYHLGIFSGTGPDMPVDAENTYLAAGKLFARYRGPGLLDIKVGYNAYYHYYHLGVSNHNLAQGFFVKTHLSFGKKNDLYILTEYQERLRIRSVANQNMDWRRGIFATLSYRYAMVEPLILVEWYDGSLLYTDDNDLLVLKTGVTGYFIKKDLLRIKLLYELEYPYHVISELSHRVSAMVQMEF